MRLPDAIKGALWGVLVVVVVAGASMALAGRDGTPSTPTAATAAEHSALPKAAKKKSHAKARRGSITFAQFRRVRTGITKAQVRHQLGTPKDRDYSEAKILENTTKMETWTYQNRGGQLHAFVFTFTDGKLDGKSSV